MATATEYGGIARTFGKDPPVSKCPEAIAIVGMGCRWPGGVSSPSQLWDLLKAKGSGYQDFTDEKFHLDGFYHPNSQRPGSFNTRGGNFLQEDPKRFDHSFFGISSSEVATMDPTQRKLLEVVFEAFENAGEPWSQFSGSQTGVFVGNFNLDHGLIQSRDLDLLPPYATTGGSASILSNRINFVFNLRGPSMTLDTACSSSMYALHLAVNSIRNGDCDSAIVAGSNLILSPDLQLFSTKLGAMSPTSTCHTFDTSADGYSRAEGFGALYLKKVSDAVLNKSPIRAVIRGTAINANGRGGGITHPSPDAQELVIRQAFQNAGGLDPDLTGYFECHGTGTPVGDPLEVSAIGRVFAAGRQHELLLVGSIKTNLGHGESSSGIAGVMKAVLAIEHGLIPPTIGLVNPNPNIDFNGSRVEVVTEMIPWPTKPVRRACVNSFGYGGANAHCILDYAESVIPEYQLRGFKAGHGANTYTGRRPNGYSMNHESHQLNGLSNNTKTDDISSHGNGINGTYNDISTKCEVDSNGRAHTNGDTYTNGDNYVNDNGHLKRSDHIDGRAASNAISKVAFDGTSHIFRSMPELIESTDSRTRSLVLLPFSGHSDYSSKANIVAIANAVSEYKLSDIAYTLSSRRSRFFQRAFAIVDSDNPAAGLSLDTATFGKSPSSRTRCVGFVFTGQGAQWPGMGAELFSEYAVFRSAIQYQDRILAKISMRPNWSIEETLLAPAATSRIHEAEFSQTICTALQIALVDLLRSWNLQPIATVGHSSGEIAAAYAVGAHTAAEAIVLAYLRGQVVAKSQRDGRMLAVGLSADGVLPYLHGKEEEIKIAAINSPKSVTLSGDIMAITELLGKLEEDKVFVRHLKTGGKAYHSHHMVLLGDEYERLAHQSIGEIADEIATEPIIRRGAFWQSSVDPCKNNSSILLGPSYWRQNLESPVLFFQAVKSLVENSNVALDLLVEIGPHPALSGPLKQARFHLEQENGCSLPVCLATLRRGEDALRSILVLSGYLFVHNTSIDLAAVNAMDSFETGKLQLNHGSLCIDLPNYQYHYGPVIYHENRYSRELRLRKHLRHDILGARQPGNTKGRPSWRNVLRVKDVPWLEDHKLIPHIVFPAAGYIAMAVEAVSQLHHEISEAPAIAGYSLRNVAINSTLQVPDDEFGVETVLNMQAVALSSSKYSSNWFQFTISSVLPHSDIWIEHCSGKISVETVRKELHYLATDKIHLRETETEPWYKKFAEHGIGYGPTFRGVSNLRAYHRKNLATADLALKPTRNNLGSGESSYPLHPAALDTCLQLGLLACHAGQVENVKHVYVPISVDSMSIWIPDSLDEHNLTGRGVAMGELRGLRGAYGRIQLLSMSGAPLLHVEKLRCVLYDGSRDEQAVRYTRDPYFRVSWKPDITILSNEQARALFPPAIPLGTIGPLFAKGDHLATYLIVQFSSLEKGIPHPDIPDHLQKFLDWIERCVDAAQAGKLAFGREALCASPDCRSQVIDQLCKEMDEVIEIRLVKRIYDHLPAVLANTTSSLQVALQDDLLTQVYKSGSILSSAYPQLVRILDLLAHKNPRMRILEIGAGTGGATRYAMKVLGGATNAKRYKNYTFTDVTTSFLSPAEAEFSSCNGMIYKKLDIGIHPLEQGFEPNYDLAIASQCLHTTMTLAETIQNVRKLLKPGGNLVMLESTQALNFVGLVFGTFPDYWNGAQDGRIDSPFLNKTQWNEVLSNNGFSGIDIVLDDLPEPVSLVSTIVATAIDPHISTQVIEPSPRPCIFIVHLDYQPPFANTIAMLLEEVGVDSVCIPLSDARLFDNPRVISLVDLDHSPLSSTSQQHFEGSKELISRAATLLWVSAGGLMKASRPTAALILGLMTTIAVERPSVRFATVDLETGFDQSAVEIGRSIVQKEQSLHQDHSARLRDTEYIMDKGCLHISRMIPDHNLNRQFRLREGLDKDFEMSSLGSQGPVEIAFEQPGLLNSLYFKADEEYLENLPEDCVEIRTMAIGLNIRDLAVATGRYDENKFSLNCSGIVHQVGSAVKDFQPGDHVWGFAAGKFGNFARTPATFLQKMAPADSYAHMASLPISYVTAIYAFMHLAHLSKGETVMIQSATGSLGMAAVRIAQHLGAEIYATVGTPEKVQFLVNNFGIDADHIFSSRELSTAFKIMEATGDKGVDVILCSAAGEQMHETWRCIAPMGRFIEVGRTDVHNNGSLSMEIFQRNATFSSFDVELLFKQKPQFGARLMTQLGEMLRDGSVKPVDVITTFDIADLEPAMMHFSSGTRIGKVVVTFENPESLLKIMPSTPRASFNPKVTYILVGCLGGLGRSLSLYMAERGARHLTYLSRSGAASPEALAMIEDLHALGVQTDIMGGDVSVQKDVVELVKRASSTRVVKGVIHAAMVLEDKSFEKTPFEQFQRILAPKVQGSMNLHEATLDIPLDFFIMTSSIVTMVGSATQAAYCAATSFQDSFARWRLSQNLPTQAFAFGPILEVGTVISQPELRKTLIRNGMYGTSEAEFLKLIEASFVPQIMGEETSNDPLAKANLLIGFEPGKFVDMYEKGLATDYYWPADARHGNLMQSIEDLALLRPSTKKTDDAADRLKKASPGELKLLVTEMIIERLSKLLYMAMDEIDPEKGVSDYGMDSMIAAELRNWVWKMFSLDISFLELLSPQMKIKDLADQVMIIRVTAV